jgi:hypothetical protein
VTAQVTEHGERQLALGVGRARRKDRDPLLDGRSYPCRPQRALADPRIAVEKQAARLSAMEEIGHHRLLAFPADQLGVAIRS